MARKASNFSSPFGALQPQGVRVTVVGSPCFVAISSRACWSFLPHFGHFGMTFDMSVSLVGGEPLTITRGDTRAKGICYHPPRLPTSLPLPGQAEIPYQGDIEADIRQMNRKRGGVAPG